MNIELVEEKREEERKMRFRKVREERNYTIISLGRQRSSWLRRFGDFNDDGRTTSQDLRFWDFGVKGADWTGQRQGFAGSQTLDLGVRGAPSTQGFHRLGTSTTTARIHRIAVFRILELRRFSDKKSTDSRKDGMVTRIYRISKIQILGMWSKRVFLASTVRGLQRRRTEGFAGSQILGFWSKRSSLDCTFQQAAGTSWTTWTYRISDSRILEYKELLDAKDWTIEFKMLRASTTTTRICRVPDSVILKLELSSDHQVQDFMDYMDLKEIRCNDYGLLDFQDSVVPRKDLKDWSDFEHSDAWNKDECSISSLDSGIKKLRNQKRSGVRASPLFGFGRLVDFKDWLDFKDSDVRNVE
ncbi:unnamed protein product [Caenorhabditis nigoni]